MMNGHRKAMLVQDHVELGNRLKHVRDGLHKVLQSFPPSSKPVSDTLAALNALERLASTLDSALCEQVPKQHDPRKLASLVYFGSSFLRQWFYTSADLERDAFAIWIPMYNPPPQVRDALTADDLFKV